MYEVREYCEPDGTYRFRHWFLQLGTRARELVDDAIERMRLGNFGDHKSLGGGLIERRIHSGPGYRIYFGQEGGRLILLLAGGTKRRQKRDIRRARSCWSDYKKNRKKDRRKGP